jgi:hypothetical protein
MHLDASQVFFRTPEARVIHSDRVTIRAIAARSQPPTSLCVWASTSIGFSIQHLRAHNRRGIRHEPGALNVQENWSRTRSYRRHNTSTTHFHPLRPRCCLQPHSAGRRKHIYVEVPPCPVLQPPPLARLHYKYTNQL